jgi:hypothetical protein
LSNILLFELGCDVRKYAIQLGADVVNGGNNYNRKSASDQRIFDGCGCRFVRNEHSELSDHAGSIAIAAKYSINGNARIWTLQDLKLGHGASASRQNCAARSGGNEFTQ